MAELVMRMCVFLEASDVLSSDDRDNLSESGSITYGDGNHTLVTAGRIIDALGYTPERLVGMARYTFIDLEN